MSVEVNQLNRAVSQAALETVVSARRFTYKPLFAMPGGHNIVDGTYKPFSTSTDSGWWGNVLSNSNGYLSTPAELVATGRVSAYRFMLAGIQDNFPVNFTLTLYSGNAVVKEIEVEDNTRNSLDIVLDQAYDIDSYKLSITRISRGSDVVKVASASFSLAMSNLMKEPGRRIHGRVEVTYANAFTEAAITYNDGAHGSSGAQLNDSRLSPVLRHFKLHDNDLSGSYRVIGSTSNAGWWPKTMPGTDGVYQTPQSLQMQFSMRTLYGLTLYFDTVYPVDFDITLVKYGGTSEVIHVTDNQSLIYSATGTYADVVQLVVTVYKSSRASYPASIIEVPVVSKVVYEDKDLIDVSLLEELTYEDSVEKMGGVSANELTVNFSNEDKQFYFNNPDSPIAKYLKKNRRVKAWLGVEVPDSDEIIWSTLGTFWTYSWDIPVGSLTAKTVAFDMLGLLGTKTYYDHTVYEHKSLGFLLDTVLTSAKEQISFLEWAIDDDLYDIIIPMAWFEYASYAAALNRLASCEMMHIYCDRDGRIVARLRSSIIDTPDDIWSDSTNIISKTYPTLYTTAPNYLDVTITHVSVEDLAVLQDTSMSDVVAAGDVRQYSFSSPAKEIISVNITSTASYTYDAYSWGMRVTFLTSGVVTGIVVNAKALQVDTSASMHVQDDASIDEYGVVSSEITSDFIQTTAHATRVANYLYSILTSSVYDVDVEYRGDIVLTLNSRISLPDGIAPENLYYIKRHELYWNGALSGSARLGT